MEVEGEVGKLNLPNFGLSTAIIILIPYHAHNDFLEIGNRAWLVG